MTGQCGWTDGHGPYDTTTPDDTFRIRPGVAPGATIVPLKVFGCDTSATTAGVGMTRAHCNFS